ncbi:hypothetical protein L1049_005562 [Liquidambar formosana]|uniref:Bifunctional inhibitor/plant lipid transfer protein/seed storage helical domain-containing protein n=1 Tax=Liquidambar formosana TaxID=63359 RepID=A0AAP0RFS3_LIQFO
MASKKPACFAAMILFLVASQAFFMHEADAAGECGKTPLRSAAASLSPCLSAAGNSRAKVPPTCCTKVTELIKAAPKCLCAVLLSPLAKQAGIKPAIAITIPKRCNIKNRPVGKKCGMPSLGTLLTGSNRASQTKSTLWVCLASKRQSISRPKPQCQGFYEEKGKNDTIVKKTAIETQREITTVWKKFIYG